MADWIAVGIIIVLFVIVHKLDRIGDSMGLIAANLNRIADEREFRAALREVDNGKETLS